MYSIQLFQHQLNNYCDQLNNYCVLKLVDYPTFNFFTKFQLTQNIIILKIVINFTHIV
jgi:hypothetical protein